MKTPRVLIVESDPKTRESLSEYLKDYCQGEVVTSFDGYEALLKVNQESFDLIVTSLVLPGSSGLKILSAAKQKNQGSVVLVIDRTEDAWISNKIDSLGGCFIFRSADLKGVKISIKNALARRDEALKVS